MKSVILKTFEIIADTLCLIEGACLRHGLGLIIQASCFISVLTSTSAAIVRYASSILQVIFRFSSAELSLSLIYHSFKMIVMDEV